ncbi:MAG: hypothetical protein ACKVP2_11980 [Burkholderiales bacterium]
MRSENTIPKEGSTESAGTALIHGVLRTIARRLWLRRTVEEVSFGVCVVLSAVLASHILHPAGSFSSAGLNAVWLPVLAGAIVTACVAWRVSRPVSAVQAADEADARAGLKDELKSACDFLSAGRSDGLRALQLARAASAARRLDPCLVVPGHIPGTLFLAAGLGALLWGMAWVGPPMLPLRDGAPVQTAEDEAGIRELREIPDDAPADGALRKLDQALRVLQDRGATTEETRQAATLAREAADQAGMEGAMAREELARIARTLKSDARWSQVADALEKGDARKAQALIEKMQGEPSIGTDADQDSRDENFRSADKGAAEGDPEFEKVGHDLRGVDVKMNQDTVAKLLDTIEESAKKLDAQEQVNRIRRRMLEDNLVATSQRSALTANQFGMRANPPNPTPSPDTGNADLQGGTLFRQAAMAKEKDDAQHEGSRAGSASGHSEALPLEGAATPRLEAQLKREVIPGREEESGDEDASGDKGWFFSASAEQKSDLSFQAVAARGEAERAGVVRHAPLPMRHRAAVKEYFLNLHESENK